MRKLDLYWKSKREWWVFENHIQVIREDAPSDAKESYYRYLEEAGQYAIDKNSFKRIRVKFIGVDDPLALRNGKIYEAIVGQKGMYCIVDETGEEYAYYPSLFEVIEE